MLNKLMLGAALVLRAVTFQTVAQEAKPAIEFRQDDAQGRLQVLIGGKEALVYVYGRDVDLAHFHPLRSPSGKTMTVAKAATFPHQRSFYFADAVQLAGQRKVDFYKSLYSGAGGETTPHPPFRDRIRHVEFTRIAGGPGHGELRIKQVWETDNGETPVLDAALDLRIVALENGEYLLDVTHALKASYGEVTFKSDVKHYACPLIRLNDDFNSKGGGLISNSEGATSQKATDMKPARWVDFSRAKADDPEGVAIFSHPSNEQPHAWLTRDYGLFGPRHAEARHGKPFVLKPGEMISTRCGVLVHKGDANSGRVADRFRAYADGRL